MKLELKHLAGYLPYGLKVSLFNRSYTLIGIAGYTIYTNEGAVLNYGSEDNEVKPILRPLSDLTKEIEVSGEKFVPSEKIDDLESDVCSYSLDYYINHTKRLPFYRIQKLLEWHFDIHKLIENNLAIDINTL